MLRLLSAFFIFWSLHQVSLQPARDIPSYIGAVVQYYPKVNPRGLKMVEENTNYYLKIIEAAGNVSVDIIVFPEFGLTSFPNLVFDKHFFKSVEYKGSSKTEYTEKTKVSQLKFEPRNHKHSPDVIKYRKHFHDIASRIPKPDENVIPCNFNDTYAKSIRMMSCAARNNSIYVVVNHYEIVNCEARENCSTDGYLLYNSNVVFDRKGRVIARYRKFNLFYEPWADRQTKPELSIFTTDFNVTFAQFTSLDMMVQDMSRAFKLLNVGNVVYSTYVFDDVPFFNTVQDQAFWAHKYQMKLLSSGFNRDGSSDIYLSKNTSVVRKIEKPRSNYMLYAKIPKAAVFKNLDAQSSDFYKIISFDDHEMEINPNILPKSERFLDGQENLEEYFNTAEWDSKLLDEQTYAAKACIDKEKECCNFVIKMKYNDSVERNYTARYSYRAVAFGQVYRLSDDSLLATEFCGVIACTSDKIVDCGKKFPRAELVNPATFSTLTITRYSHRSNLSFSAPFFAPVTSANGAMMDVDKQFHYKARTKHHSTSLVLHMITPTENLEIFGTNGRVFDAQDWKLIKKTYLTLLTIKVIGFIVISVTVAWLLFMTIWKWCIVKRIKRECERLRRELGEVSNNDATLPLRERTTV